MDYAKNFIDDYSIERALLNAFDIGYKQAAGEQVYQVYIDYTKLNNELGCNEHRSKNSIHLARLRLASKTDMTRVAFFKL